MQIHLKPYLENLNFTSRFMKGWSALRTTKYRLSEAPQGKREIMLRINFVNKRKLSGPLRQRTSFCWRRRERLRCTALTWEPATRRRWQTWRQRQNSPRINWELALPKRNPCWTRLVHTFNNRLKTKNQKETKQTKKAKTNEKASLAAKSEGDWSSRVCRVTPCWKKKRI